MKKLGIIVGLLMIFASFVAAVMANYFLSFWAENPSGQIYRGPTMLVFLYLAIITFAATGFCFVGGVLSLMNKYPKITKIGLYALVASAFASSFFIVGAFILGVPMFSFFLPIYFLIWLSEIKLPQITNIKKLTGITLLISAIITVNSGITIFNNLRNNAFPYRPPQGALSFFGLDYLGILYFVVAGFCVLGGVILFTKQYHKLSLLSAIFLMASGFTATFLYTFNGWDLVAGLLLGFPQLFLSLISFILLKIHNLHNMLNEEYTRDKKILN